MSVRQFLLFDNCNPDILHTAQNFPDWYVAGAVQRGIDNMKRLTGWTWAKFQDDLIIGFNRFTGNILNHSGRKKKIKRGEMIRQIILKSNLLLYKRSSAEGDLASVGTIYLITVKSGRIVRCGNHYACRSRKMTNCKAEHRCRLENRIYEYTDPHLSQDGSRKLGKITGMDSAVKADGAGRVTE